MVFKEKKLRGAERLSSLRRKIMPYIRAFSPQLVALEGYAYDAENRLADLGEIGGILRVELHDLKIPYIVVPPTMLKQFVTGSGDASKEKMIHFVNRRYRFLTENDNIADAVGLAKFAEVISTGCSRFRSELEVVKNFTKEKITVRTKYKKTFAL
jgi:Holliday junction resolvasome RuvABC endonuclease subunit